jgi:hypothetical protein
MKKLLRKIFLVDLVEGLLVTFRYQHPEAHLHRAISGGTAQDR